MDKRLTTITPGAEALGVLRGRFVSRKVRIHRRDQSFGALVIILDVLQDAMLVKNTNNSVSLIPFHAINEVEFIDE